MKHAWLLVICSLALTVMAAAAELTLVKDGTPNAVIIVEAAPAPAAKPDPKKPAPLTNNQRAAQELQKYIEKMSGAKLPVVEEGQPVEGNPAVQILVGYTKAAAKLGVKIPSGFNPAIRPDFGEEEGFVLKTSGNALVVAGNNDGPYKGTLYAAYALLEQLGCRWYFPGAWGEVVPEKKTVTVPELDVTSQPDFSNAGLWLSGWVPITASERQEYADWCTKVRFGRYSGLPGAGDGTLASLLPPAEYAETHPEYYAMNKAGQRTVTPKSPTHGTMLCLSNPDVLTAVIERLKTKTFADGKQNSIGFSPPDGAPFCYCENCLKGSQNFDYPNYVHERMQSEEFFSFAAKVAQAFPDKWIGTMAYSLREMPPQGVKLPPNVAVTLAPITCCVVHPVTDPTCWRRQEYLNILTQWRRQTPHVMIYDYNPGFLLGMWVPERDMANFAANVPVYKQIGIKGFAAEGRKAFMQTWISYYMRSRLLWDAETDVAALKQDFYTTFFGSQAGPAVQAWWDACEAALATSKAHVHEDWLVNHIYTPAFVAGIRKHVDAALAAPATKEQHARVEAFALIADHLAGYADMYDAQRRMDFKAAAVAAQRMTDCKVKLNKINSFFISLDATPRPYFSEGHKLQFEELAARRNGDKGVLIADLPLEMKFSHDRFNEGVIGEWYAPAFDDKKWGVKNTFLTWDQQDPPIDAAGHDYDGYGWYRAAFTVDKKFAGKPVKLYLGALINEGWVWVNGQFAGHVDHQIWWMNGPREVDVTKQIKPGQRNTIAIRVWNNAEIGGLRGRGFLWSPKP
ncbi:MAG: DUF4838 domain-containing protein [Armatimonadota bacterium]